MSLKIKTEVDLPKTFIAVILGAVLSSGAWWIVAMGMPTQPQISSQTDECQQEILK